jgi:hypothetical protein
LRESLATAKRLEILGRLRYLSTRDVERTIVDVDSANRMRRHSGSSVEAWTAAEVGVFPRAHNLIR